MFLHYLVSLNKDEMLSKFFVAQWNNPVKHDWTVTVQKDLEELGLNFELSQIKAFKKEKFADIVKKACKASAFKELMSKKQSHSKLDGLNYTELSMKEYLKSDLITPDKAKSLYKYRVRSAKVKNNMKSAHSDLNCPLCDKTGLQHLDDQHNLLHCRELVKTSLATVDGKCCPYEDIFSENVQKMSIAVDLLDKSMELRETLLKEACGQHSE